MTKPIIFCDFDGTITESDNILRILNEFAPPEAERVKDDILAQRISIVEGVTEIFSMIPSSKKADIIEFILEDAVIREGFKEFMNFVKDEQIPFYIVSGGIDFFLEPLVDPYGPYDGIYCNTADFSVNTIQLGFPHKCDAKCQSKGCGCCKPSVIRTLAQDHQMTIIIGDSITDLQAAKVADLVIARDFLIEKCEELAIPYEPFKTFIDVKNIIEEKLRLTK
ncbi:2-hydroxy-3-keto-5-methylthiopentenyl-1-phosphate phosphatase [Lysinibacillus contaminans]|uniref:2-hydroxy-3-keto-5-methylthiopentenyl-1-phosphate phosphatase n=1 Tax=Lysinibacillus contaminans TaxID=1293441 RepID=A0ABR5JZD9_9BACI|nr:2-hydroxy-3-keto-5-methylthiopentenyl-1-phosphate phosphatase [Lysinibacillus contaminans]KOS67815.1 2-hydroxy-3-keto-5-methylthiopentenyl-1-phosphate phosphatase [Lysinibacillus contaminans]